jgi:hypothetical protein
MEFPPQRLAAVLQECKALPGGIRSDPPRSIMRMSADERTSLADTLAAKFTHDRGGRGAVNPAEAMLAWLMVQSARLRTLSPQANASVMENTLHGLAAAGFPARMNFTDPRAQPARLAAEAPFKNAHDASVRPEYAAALNDLLKHLKPNPFAPLHPTLLRQIEDVFNHQRTTEKRISPQVDAMVERHGLETLAREGYRLNPRSGNFKSEAERAGAARFIPSAPPEVPQPSAPSSSRQGESLSRSDSSLSQQSVPDMSDWLNRAQRDLPR